MTKVIVLAIHRPNRAPNEKYRWMQFEPYFKKYLTIQYLYLVNEQDDKILFHSNNTILKFFVYIKTFFKRLFQILYLNKSDVVIVYRELHWFHCPILLGLLRRKTQKLIFDFDDAIFLPSNNFIVDCIKQPKRKTIHFIKHADVVITGNNYLKDFSVAFNKNTFLIPTVVDTHYFIPMHHLRHLEKKVVIGWMGSHSTIQHLFLILPVLKFIKDKYPFIEYKFVAQKTYIPELSVYVEDWNLNTEVEVLNSFDIGLMPLPNDEWSKGKCGLKLLTYLACEVPAVTSDIGANTEIIQKTNGGILVKNTENDWINALSKLIENKELRINLGKEGRKAVERYYSVQSWQSILLKTIIQ